MNISFLYPYNLFLLGLSLLPPLLHLIKQKRYRLELFPDIRLIRKAEEESRRRFRLQDILLLLLRMGVLAFLALAAAFPTIYFEKGNAPARQNIGRTVLILDTGYAMDMLTEEGDTKLLIARQLAERFLESLPSSSKVTLFCQPPSQLVKGLFWQETGMVKSLLPHLSSSFLPQDFRLAIEEGVRFLGEEGGRIVCLTDGRWLSRLKSPVELNGCQLDLVLFNQPKPDASLQLAGLEKKDDRLSLTFNVIARGISGEAELIIHSQQGETRLPLQLSDEVPQEVNAVIDKTDWGYGELSMPGDSLSWNNFAYFASPQPPKVAFLLPSSSSGDNPIVRALHLNAEDTRYQVSFVSGEDISKLGADNCLVADQSAVDDRNLKSLESLLSAGGSVMLFGKQGITNPGAKTLLAEGLGANYVALGAGDKQEIIATGTNPSILPESVNLEQLRMLGSSHFQAPPGVTLAQLSDGSAGIVGGKSELGGKLCALLIPLDSSLSNLASSAVFVPLLDRLVQGICWQPTPRLNLGEHLVGMEAVGVVPQGETTSLIELPGVYRLQGPGGISGLGSANVEELAPLPGNEEAQKLIAQGFNGGEVNIISPGTFDEYNKTVRGFSLTVVLLCLAIALLILEALVFPPAGRRPSP
jgi:hypothetical protein